MVSVDGAATSTHWPAWQMRSPLHCVSYWQPVAAGAGSGTALAPPGGPPAPSRAHEIDGAPPSPAASDVQYQSTPRHCAVQVLLPHLSFLLEITTSSGGQPTCPEDISAMEVHPTASATNSRADEDLTPVTLCRRSPGDKSVPSVRWSRADATRKRPDRFGAPCTGVPPRSAKDRDAFERQAETLFTARVSREM